MANFVLIFQLRWSKLDEGKNFKQLNFRMADISNLNINQRSNVEQPILRVTKIENKNWDIEASKLIYIKGQI